ncbi:hypothetical protein ABZ805_27540 [Saccharopolyspora sp. NPDC047091]|uniref:hypothetical protein n=1 Tax=Saccharopolyspora sp. NPDC047091 TaxID=3155924 RepID=UPI0033E4527E
MQRLQRLLGNAATAQILGSSPRPGDRDARRLRNSGAETRDVTVQRDVGFEIEVPGIHTRAFSPPPKEKDDAGWELSPASSDWAPRRAENTRKRSVLTPPSQARLLEKGTKLVRADTFTIESDEALSQLPPSTDLEFVTIPFPETDQGAERLTETVSRILAVASLFNGDGIHTAESLAEAAKGSAQHPTDLPPNHSGTRHYTEAAYVAYGFGGSGNPQATAGIRLDRVERLVQDLARPEVRGDGPAAQQGESRLSLSAGDCTSRAQQGVDRHMRSVAGSGGPEPDPAPSGKLRGLLVVITAYLLHGDGRHEKYYKGVAPLMGRTDFGRMFTLLEPDEQDRLAANDGSLLVDLALGSAGLAGRADEPVLLGLGGPGQSRAIDFTELTRRRWLREITQGHDLLSKHGYEGYASRRTDEGFEHRKGAEFESMGALGFRTEDVHGVQAPIFELRRLRPSVLRAEWAPLLLQVFNAVRAANTAPHVG